MKDSPEYKKLNWHLRGLIEHTGQLESENAKKIEDLNSKIKSLANIQMPAKLKAYLCPQIKVWQEPKWLPYGGTGEKLPTYTVEQLEEMLAKDTETYEENLKIIKENQQSFNLACDLMKRFGLQESKQVVTSTRSYKKKTVESGWLLELKSHFNICIGRGESEIKGAYEGLINTVRKYHADIAAAEEIKEAEAKSNIRNQERAALTVKIVDKYKLSDKFTSPIPEVGDLLHELIKLNKYLYLAHYLALNRSDWSDGHAYADIGINGFLIETERDREIFTNIRDCMYANWDGDGRVFRDATWGYDALFGIVMSENQELYENYDKLKEYSSI